MKSLVERIIPFSKKILFKNPDRWKFWVLLSAILKATIFLLHISQAVPNSIPGFIGYVGGDTPGYLDPAENLIIQGNYSPDYRMPGYAVFYLPLRLIFTKAIACNIILIIQVLISSASVYFLALTARISFRSEKMFFLVFYLFAISTYSNLFDGFLLTESLCTSFTIFSVYFLTYYFQNRRLSYLFISGIFITWVIFLRPVFAPLLLLFCVAVLWDGLLIRLSKKLIIRSIMVLVLFFSVMESCWMVRNYETHKKVIVLARSVYYPVPEDSYLIELMDFVKSWGGDRTWWNPVAEITWFGVKVNQREGVEPLQTRNVHIPTYIFTSQFTMDSLITIRSYIHLIDLHSTSETQRSMYTQIVKSKLQAYTESIRKEKPFLYYVKGPLVLLKKFFLHSGTYNLFNKSFEQLSLLMKSVKVFYSLVYLFTILMGFVGIVWMLFKRHYTIHSFLLIGIPLYSTLFFPFIFKQIEYRYFVPAYPFIIVMAAYSILSIARMLTAGHSKITVKK